MLKKIILLIVASLTLNFSVKSTDSELQNTEEIKKKLSTTLAKHPEILEAIQIAQRIEKTQEVKPQDIAQLQKLYSKLEKSTDLSEEQRVQIKNLGERLQAFSAPACETMNVDTAKHYGLVATPAIIALIIKILSSNNLEKIKNSDQSELTKILLAAGHGASNAILKCACFSFPTYLGAAYLGQNDPQITKEALYVVSLLAITYIVKKTYQAVKYVESEATQLDTQKN
ncbi:TPA: hypothetical protein DEO28_04470 [Candidatus Dependentiae bacterium]|nr:MAG: hypothetical protein UR14_C0002G0012 [candidate division TM6 bacterium GW2011_GWE2_31_21]KKP53809.1 MAG: hypothetical protein UR43_C0002G0012 [candidate division TM6 bacterium GW2011_GWF2_33_332]HBS47589.1 hypothetical protein [Candidatus Dependentiae bacterium]HBZ73738.1 hypothetical protein [Candidatus Dependentiae bacterium]